MSDQPPENPRNAAAQGTLGYSRWDRLEADAYFRSTDGLDHQAAHFEARTNCLTRALEDPSNENLRKVVDEFKLRDAAFHRRNLFLQSGHPRVFQVLDVLAYLLVAVLVLAACACGFAGAMSGSRWYLVLGLIVSIHLIRFIVRLKRDSADSPTPFEGIFGLYFAKRCPDCEHDLRGLPDSIDPARIEGIHVGPPVCPECGSRWPLFPCAAGVIREHLHRWEKEMPRSLSGASDKREM